MPGAAAEEVVIDIVARFQDKASQGASQVDRSLAGTKKTATDYMRSLDSVSRKANELRQKQASLSQKIAEASSKYSAARSKADTYSKGVEALKSRLGGLKTEHQNVSTAIQQVESKLKQATSGAQTNQAQISQLSSTLKQLQDREKELSQGISANAQHLESATQKQNGYAQAAKDSAEALNRLKSESGRVSSELQTASDKIASYQAKLRELSAAGGLSSFGQSLENTGNNLITLGQGFNKIGNKMTLGVTTPLLAAGKAAFTMSSQYEDSVAKVSTIADTSVRSIEELSAGITGLSKRTGESAASLNEALYQSISATGNTADSLGYVEVATKAAIGGFTDAATAIDGLTTIMNSYGMQGMADMQMVSDQMLMAQNYGKTTFGELAFYMGQVVPIAAQLNIGTDTLMATMAALTKNGIRTRLAVTGLKAALSNIIKPSQEASEAAETLGLDFSASALQSKGLQGFLSDVKQALENASPEYASLSERAAACTTQMTALEEAGKKGSDTYKALSKEQKNIAKQMETIANATDSPISGFATMFGSVEGLNSMMVLTSETGAKDLQGAMDAMAQSAGATESAFEKMENTKGTEMKKSLNELRNAGIELGDTLAPTILKVAESVSSLAEKFSELDPAVQEGIVQFGLMAFAAGPVLKVFGGLTSGAGKLVKGIGSLLKGRGVASAAATAAGGLNTAARSTTLFARIAGKLPGKLALAAAAVAAVGIAMDAYHKKCLQDNLEEHFGDVKLSMEEIEDVAKRLTTNDFTMRIDAVTESAAQVQSFKESMESSLSDINKAHWKVSVGLELTPEEISGYKESIDNFITNAQSYAEQQHLTTTLAIDAILTPGTQAYQNASDTAKSYYTGLDKQLSDLGTELSELVNTAFADNILTADEVDKIDEVQKRITEKTNEIENARYNLRLRNLSQDALRGGLDSDSFTKLIEQMNTELENRKQSVENSQMDLLIPYQVKLDNGEISQDQFNEQVKAVELETSRQLGNITLNGLEIGIGTIKARYDDEFKAAQPDFDAAVQDFFANAFKNPSAESLGRISPDFMTKITKYGLQGDSRENVKTLLEKMHPMTDKLLDYAGDWLKSGLAVPSEIMQGIQDTLKTEIMSGDMTHELEYLGMQISKSPEYIRLVEEAKKSGAPIGDEFIRGIEMGSGKVFDKTTGLFKDAEKAVALSAESLNTLFSQMGVDASSAFASGFTHLDLNKQTNISALVSGMETAMWKTGEQAQQTAEEIAAAFQSVHIPISEGISEAIGKAAPELQIKLSGYLASLFSGMTLDGAALSTVFSSLGATLDEGLKHSLAGLDSSIQQGLVAAVASADPAAALEALKARFPQNNTLSGLTFDINAETGAVTIAGLQEQIQEAARVAGAEAAIQVPAQIFPQQTGLVEPSSIRLQVDTTKAKSDLQQFSSTAVPAPPLSEIPNTGQVAEQARTDLNTTMTEPIAAPQLSDIPNARTVAETARSVMEAVFSVPLRISIGNITGGANTDVSAHASGGMVQHKTLSWLAEEGYPEMVIPLDPARRARALGLWRQTGSMLGIEAEKHAAGGLVGYGKTIPFPRADRDKEEQEDAPAASPSETAAASVAVSSGVNVAVSPGAVQINVQVSGGGKEELVEAIEGAKEEIAGIILDAVNDGVSRASANTPVARRA